MPFIYLLIALSFIACKTDNKTASKPLSPIHSLKNYTEKMKDSPQLVFPHAPHASVLRNKLLTQLIDSNFDKNKKTIISKDDEFSLQEGKNDVDPVNLERFQQHSSNEAKVFVSYSDKIQAYLIPANLPIKGLMEFLKIQEEDDRELIWLSSQEGETKPGQSIYLLSVNHKDLMDFDRISFSETILKENIGNDFVIALRQGQIAHVSVKSDYYLQAMQQQKFQSTALKCTKDDVEAGACEPCTFFREVPSSQYKLEPQSSFNDLNFNVMIGEKNIEMVDLSPRIVEKEVSLTINAGQFTSNEITDFRITMQPKPKPVLTNGHSFSNRCLSRNIAVNEILAAKVVNKYTVKIYGRGTILNSIRL